MREVEFREHLDAHRKTNGRPLEPDTINTYISDVRRVETEILLATSGITIDEEFVRDGLHEIYNSFEPTEADEAHRHENQNTLNFGVGKDGTASGYRASIKHYHRFCLRHPRI